MGNEFKNGTLVTVEDEWGILIHREPKIANGLPYVGHLCGKEIKGNRWKHDNLEFSYLHFLNGGIENNIQSDAKCTNCDELVPSYFKLIWGMLKGNST